VDAYEKDPVTGIVAHLDDQCIGCRYCMLTCPYEVPSYNSRLGIVRKCDMCSHRLAEGEPPACVQGCPTAAISIGLADISELAASHEDDPAGRLVPTAPKSRLTSPTTRYRTERPVPTDAVAGDEHRLSPSHNHPPLVAMLVLTQVSVGAVAVAMAGSRLGGWFGEPGRLGAGPAVLAFATAMVAMGAAVLHLGRPLMAWRAVLGVRHSWLSREILAFGAYAGLAGAAAACALGALPRSWEGGLGVATVAAGALGLWSSACLYSVTGHPLWRIDRVAARFGATALVGGSAAVAAVASTAVAADPVATTRVDHAAIGRAAALAVAIGVISMLATAAAFLWRHRDSRNALGRSAHLMNHQLAGRVRLAAALGLATICLAAVAGLGPDTGSGVTALLWVGALLGAVGAAWVERGLFFTADAPDRMPGGSR
jgi:DMSO reductase anchor subunit/ferredoxin